MLFSNGPEFAHVEVFNRDGQLVSVNAIPVQFKVSVTEPSGAVNAGMAKEKEKRPQLALWFLIGWLVGYSYSSHCDGSVG